jgi:hypothetical protein
MPKSDMNKPVTDVTEETGFGDTGPDDTKSVDDGTKRRTTRYGPEQSGNKLKPATKTNSSER